MQKIKTEIIFQLTVVLVFRGFSSKVSLGLPAVCPLILVRLCARPSVRLLRSAETTLGTYVSALGYLGTVPSLRSVNRRNFE